jgi:hypothetical protein
MTSLLVSFRLLAVKWISFILIISLFWSVQQRPVVGILENTEHSIAVHSHDDEGASFFEVIEILLTGNLVHSHDHEEAGGETNAHAHQHHFGFNTGATAFIVAQVHLSFPIFKQTWQAHEPLPNLNPYHFEILRPPIQA